MELRSRSNIRLSCALALGLAVMGCEQVQALIGPKPAAAATVEKPAPPAKAEDAKDGKDDAEAKGDKVHAATSDSDSDEFQLPFAWETSTEEPLAQARTFLREAYAANTDYMHAQSALFPTFADKQSPRATIVTCADSRVQAPAFDATPENDDFTIRNIGNQVENSLGSVEYGVEHLNTPVLLVLGHTGCGAVKAAMDGTGKLEEPIKKELEHIHPPKSGGKSTSTQAWADAVVANVHDQVAVALKRFSRRVHAGKLTVVGAVFDFRNDLGQGAGRLLVVDVNGNRERSRIDAFVDAVNKNRGGASAEDSDADVEERPSRRTSLGGRNKRGGVAEPEPPVATVDFHARGSAKAREESRKALLEAVASLPTAQEIRGSHRPD